jgi:hypothetical protein
MSLLVITYDGRRIFEFFNRTIDPSFPIAFDPSLNGSNLISIPVAPPESTKGRTKVFFS